MVTKNDRDYRPSSSDHRPSSSSDYPRIPDRPEPMPDRESIDQQWRDSTNNRGNIDDVKIDWGLRSPNDNKRDDRRDERRDEDKRD